MAGEDIPQGDSALTLALNNVVKTIKAFKAHLEAAAEDLTEFKAAVEAFEAELEGVGAELGQMAGSTHDEQGKHIYRELIATEKAIQKQIEDIRADTRITQRVALAMEESLQELLDEQAALLISVSPSVKQ